MSLAVERMRRMWQHDLSDPTSPTRSRRAIQKVLLACGVLYSLLYVIVNDVIAASLYEGYSRTSQAISELSATAAPTRALLVAMVPVFTVLMIAFGIGVWRAGQKRRPLRIAGAFLMIQGATFPLWLFAPMTSRGQLATSATVSGDNLGHLVLTIEAMLLILGEVGFGAAAFGRRFRIYSFLTAATILVFGGLTGLIAGNMLLGEPTVWMGVFDRVSFAAWLVWLAALAIAILRRIRLPEGAHSASPTQAHAPSG